MRATIVPLPDRLVSCPVIVSLPLAVLDAAASAILRGTKATFMRESTLHWPGKFVYIELLKAWNAGRSVD